jgi:hypothetical protein
MSIHKAIFDSPLKYGDKAVLWALLMLSDWNTGANIDATIGNIARGAGQKPTTTRAHLAALIKGRYVAAESASNNRYLLHINVAALQSLVGNRTAAETSGQPAQDCPPPQPSGNLTRGSPENRPGPPVKLESGPPENQPGPSRKPTAALQNPRGLLHNPVLNLIPPPQAADAGSGGGGDSAVPGNDASMSSRSERDAARDLMIEFGVMVSTAEALANKHPLVEVKAGIAWTLDNASEAESPPAILVTALRDGTAKAALDADLRARSEAEAVEQQRQRRRRRAKKIQDLFGWTWKKAEEKGADVVKRVGEMWRQIKSVWPQPEQAAEAWDIPDSELFDPEAKGWDLFRKLVAAAKQQTDCHAPPSP